VADDPSYDGSEWSQCPSTIEETEALATTLRSLERAGRLESPEALFLLAAIDAGMLPLDGRVAKLLESTLLELLERAPSPVCAEVARALVAIDSREGLQRIAAAITLAIERREPARFAESFVLRRITQTRHAAVLFPTLERVLAAAPNPEDPDWQPDVSANVSELKNRLRL
jgi:hypothetical protein